MKNNIKERPAEVNLLLADCLSKYIYDKHTQEECSGFIDGFKSAQEKNIELIEELLRVLKLKISPMTPKVNQDIIHEEIKEAITKAEKHIKNNKL